ncbi:acyltransferase [Streptococcus iniae]|uniref:acyltransferase family protein n=1 Tax=Streptococcus iniae TaxID=1346 RepID=UPI002B27F7FB|nr:acyltransferase [Streptococcus iniae]WNZ90897.1 acyltransferase [Streptococcus iniae]
MKIKNNLAEQVSKKSQNLNLIRFICALFVIICHAYPLSLGRKHLDPLASLSGNTLTFGNLAVAVFFIASGFLIYRSIERRPNFNNYLKARLIRIFPPLFFVVLITVFILGPFLTTLTIGNYFMSKDTWLYFMNAVLLPKHSLPGLFSSNTYGNVVNGALWTLPVEFACYLAIYVAFKLKLTQEKVLYYTILPVFVLFTFINLSQLPFLILVRNFSQPVFMFYVGVCYYVYKNNIPITKLFFLISLIGFTTTVVIHMAWLGLFVFFPYLIIYLSFGMKQISQKMGQLGNLSYGIYLCAFPIQQTIVYFFGGKMLPLLNIGLASVCSIVVGYVIYYWAEKRMLERLH